MVAVSPESFQTAGTVEVRTACCRERHRDLKLLETYRAVIEARVLLDVYFDFVQQLRGLSPHQDFRLRNFWRNSLECSTNRHPVDARSERYGCYRGHVCCQRLYQPTARQTGVVPPVIPRREHFGPLFFTAVNTVPNTVPFLSGLAAPLSGAASPLSVITPRVIHECALTLHHGLYMSYSE